MLQFIVGAGRGVSLSMLRVRFPTAGTAVRVCLQRRLLELRGDCYHATAQARAFLADSQVGSEGKRCAGCRRLKPVDAFWTDRSRHDGLHPYCIECCNERKAKIMEAKRQQAIEAIRTAGLAMGVAALRWDDAVRQLAGAWADLVQSERVLLEHKHAAGITDDSGPMELRLIYPRAMFAMSLALADAGYPIGHPLHRDSGFPAKLAEYVGDDPAAQYVGKNSSSPACDESGEAAAAPIPAVVASARHRRKKHRRQARVRTIVPQEAPA